MLKINGSKVGCPGQKFTIITAAGQCCRMITNQCVSQTDTLHHYRDLCKNIKNMSTETESAGKIFGIGSCELG